MKPRSDRSTLLTGDTPADVEELLVSLWRQMTPAVKLARLASVSHAVVALARAGARQRHQDSGEQACAVAAVKLGQALASAAYAEASGPPAEGEGRMDHLQVVMQVIGALNACGVRYVVGGSLASSVSGEPRATLDADIMVDVTVANVRRLIAALGSGFYTDVEAFQRAVRDHTSTNIVHLATATKVDLFVMGATSIESRQMDRRQVITLDTGEELYVYTAEDILLQKLRWFRLGGEVSDRQWRDIAGIIAVQGERLDVEYLRASAEVIGVRDLLERALD